MSGNDPGNGDGRPGGGDHPSELATEDITRHVSPEQATYLEARGISIDFALSLGVISAGRADELPAGCPESWAEWLPALLFPWSNGERVEWQIHPDTTPIDSKGNAIKYAIRSRDLGYEPLLWIAKRGSDENGPHLLVEGTCQTIAAARYSPDDVTVIGMIGCRGWSSEGVPLPDLALFEGKRTIVALDADMSTNPNVWDAAEALQHALKYAGVPAPIRFLRVPAGKKAGLDDVLGRTAAEKRTAGLARLIESAETEKFPKSRRPKAKDGDENRYFGDGGLKAQTLSEDIAREHPMALTREGKIALYRNGVYGINGLAFEGAIADRLGEDHRPHHVAAAESYTRGRLHNDRRTLSEYVTDPLMNIRNGMLDLVTGTLKPHDPAYMSSVQFPIEWDPDAKCPTYERWIESVGIADQIDDLEESVSVMLDPSRTPTKAVFLFGPSRSGKSTFIRLLEAIAGIENTSGVNLVQLSENTFMPANVFGMALNVSSDLQAAHIEDISTFKLMTGEDLIQANRKNGKQFAFRNKALFAFAANELPTVGEGSRAYVERIKPFRFGRSFAGHEDPTIETAMRAEIPGILVRWVKAWQRLTARGSYLPTSAAVRAEFETRSDRVQQWMQEDNIVEPAEPKTKMPAGKVSTATVLHRRFSEWAKDNGVGSMGRTKLAHRLKAVPGVVEVTFDENREALNIRPRAAGDPWAGRPGQPAGTSGQFSSTSIDSENEESPAAEPSDCVFSVLPHNAEKSTRNHPDPESAAPGPVTTPDPPAAGSSSTGPTMAYDDEGTQALDVLLALAPVDPYEPAPCADCDGPLSLVPISPKLDGGFWYACNRCTPHTFERV